MGLSSGDTFTSVSHCVSFRIRGRGKSDFFSWVYIPHIHNKSLSWNVALNKKTIEELILYVTLWSSCPQFVRIVSTTASFSLFIFVQKKPERNLFLSIITKLRTLNATLATDKLFLKLDPHFLSAFLETGKSLANHDFSTTSTTVSRFSMNFLVVQFLKKAPLWSNISPIKVRLKWQIYLNPIKNGQKIAYKWFNSISDTKNIWC